MKKFILSIGLAGLLFGMNGFAAENDSLTKATVKLIKNYHNLEQKINNIDNSNLDNGSNIKNIQSDIESMKQEDSRASNAINQNSDRINAVEGSVKKVEAISLDAKKVAYQTQEIVNEMRGLSKNFKDQTSEVVGSAKVAYQKSTINETKVNSMTQALEETSKDSKNTQVEVQMLKKSLNELSTQFTLYKVKSEKELENLNVKYDNLKAYTDAELKVLKTKFDRAKPVYVLDKEDGKLDCSKGKCKDNDSDKIIDNFIK